MRATAIADLADRGRADHLRRLLQDARGLSVEFDPFLANHLPMALVILSRLGASEGRLEAFAASYTRANGLKPAPSDAGRIDGGTWRDHLGARDYEGDYRAFFKREVERLGAERALRLYLPELVPGIAASALHALMRLAYARLEGDDEETVVGLGYWAATFLPLGMAGRGKPITDEPADLLRALREIEGLRGLHPPSDLLWHWMREAASRPEFPPVVDLLSPAPDLLARVARASLALMAGTMSFEALHAVTATHWVRLVGDGWPDRQLALRYLWQALAAVYPKMGFPVLPSAGELQAMREIPAPTWHEISARAVLSDDEHDLSFVFSAMEEERVYGDRLYRVLAGKRMGLVT